MIDDYLLHRARAISEDIEDGATAIGVELDNLTGALGNTTNEIELTIVEQAVGGEAGQLFRRNGGYSGQ